MERKISDQSFAEAQQYIPGGVNSPVRAYQSVGGSPLFIARGNGSRLVDVDDNVYIDYIGAWGPLIHGHCHPKIIGALKSMIDRGTGFGNSTQEEIRLAQLICKAYPSIEKLRLVNSGTEATMSAIRLARAFTGRDMVIKFDGCYHGHVDGLLVKAGSGVATFGLPDSPGVPKAYASLTISVPYNNLEKVQSAFTQNPERIACIIVEPVAGNMGVVAPRPGFLAGLRRLTRERGALLIFDEVMSGCRVALGGAQELFRMVPDLTCLGKIIGGGLPVGAFGGRGEIMKQIAPEGAVYQAGTLSGNPLTVTAGIASLQLLQDPAGYDRLDRMACQLCDGLQATARNLGLPVTINRVGSMFTLFFTGEEVTDYSSARSSHVGRYAIFFQEMLKRGVLFPPSQFEATFLSLAHDDDDIHQTLSAATEAFRMIAGQPS